MPHRARWPLFALIFLQSLQLLSLLPWLLFAGFSVMAFDAPGSEKMWQPWLMVGAIWSYPLWLLLAGLGSWLLYRWHHDRSAVILSAVFALPLPAFVVVVFA
jgi:hypothetical protein